MKDNITNFVRISARNIFIVSIFLVGVSWRQAHAELVRHPKPTCAVIASPAQQLDQSPLLDLIEVQLSKEPDLVLLNRSEINKVLGEHALTLFALSDSATNRKWGLVVRADLLVMLERRQGKDGSALEVSAIETKHGLRRSYDQLVWNDNVEDMASLAARAILRALKRASKDIQFVLAVPPFESGDFAFDFDHLKRTYAQLVEQAVQEFPGAVVVELDHALKIAAELSITEGTSELKRGLPYYLIGRYQTNGQGETRRVNIELVFRRGEQVIATEKKNDIEPSVVGPFLRQVVINLLEKHLAVTRSLPRKE